MPDDIYSGTGKISEHIEFPTYHVAEAGAMVALLRDKPSLAETIQAPERNPWEYAKSQCTRAALCRRTETERDEARSHVCGLEKALGNAWTVNAGIIRDRDEARRWAGIMYRWALKAEAMLDEASDINEELVRERDAYWQRVKQLEAQISV